MKENVTAKKEEENRQNKSIEFLGPSGFIDTHNGNPRRSVFISECFQS